MTDIIDDTLTWEQRREIRRKKRHELLAEADRIVKNDDQVSSSQTTYTQSGGDDDSFEQERQRRRKEREEKRRKEREELETQLREEDDARAERERKREERRRQREDGDSVISSYSANESHRECEAEKAEEKEEPEQADNDATEEPDNTESDYLNQNGDKHDDDVEEQQDASEDVDEEKEEQDIQQTEVSITISSVGDVENIEDESQEVDEESEEDEACVVQPEKEDDHGTDSDNKESEELHEKSRSELLQERRQEREKQRLEEEEREREEVERRKAEHEAKLQREKEERAKRMAESEAKRKELTKQTSTEAKELTVKGTAATTVLLKSDPTKTSLRAKERSRTRATKTEDMIQENAVLSVKPSSSSGEASIGNDAGSRKTKRSRHSLKALEKQADDLYDFLSELEVQKSAGPAKLKEFLKGTEKSEDRGKQAAKPMERLSKSFHVSTEEHKTSAQIQRERNGLATDKPVENELKHSPKPPTRSDSMRRLEEAKTKYFRPALSKEDRGKQGITEVDSSHDGQDLSKIGVDKQFNAIKMNLEKAESTENLDAGLTDEPAYHNESKESPKKSVLSLRSNRSNIRRKLDDNASPVEDSSTHSTMKNLNERIADSPKAHKDKADTNVAKLSSLDDRLKSYKSKAERQDTGKKIPTPRTGKNDVANRLNMWETGKVATPDKTPKKAVDTVVVKQSAAVSSRKNLWETGKVASAAEKKAARAEVHGSNLASRKNMWLKATQDSTKSPGGKSDDTQVIKTGVMSRLNKWEKGEVAGSTGLTPKQKASNVTASDVRNRRSKWEHISQESASQPTKKTPVVHTMITTEVSSRKTLYETKTSQSQVTRKDSIEEQEPPEPVGRSATKPKRKDSLSSGDSDEDVLSDASDEGQNGQHLELDSGASDRD